MDVTTEEIINGSNVQYILEEEKIKDEAYKAILEHPAKILGRILDKIELANKFCDLVPLYYDKSNVFWMFSQRDKYWEIVDDIDILNMIQRASESNIVLSKERTEIMNAIKQVARSRKPKDLKPTMIQFKNEIFDIETGERIISTCEWFGTNPIPYKLPDVKTELEGCPTIDKLFRAWVVEEDVKKLYEIFAYCLIPSYPIERMITLHGAGSNGKSEFRRILRHFLGERNCTSTDFNTLNHSRFEKTKLYKKLLCEMGETQITKLESTDTIKKLVSNKDLIGGEYKNKGQFDFINYAKLLISSNSLPPTEDKTDGFYRKNLIIDFPNQFKEGFKIEVPEVEFEALAGKCLNILYELLQRGTFDNEGNIEDRKKRYEERSNPIDKFIALFVSHADPNADISKSFFHRRYCEWLKENKLREVSEVSLSRNLKDKGWEEGRPLKQWYENSQAINAQVRSWLGVSWK